MGFYTGRNGSIQLGGQIVLKVRDWSLESTVELLSTNTLGDFANSFVPGLKGATGSATVMYYRKETGDNGIDFQTVLNESGIMRTGAIDTNRRVRLKLNAAGASNENIEFDAYITSASVGVSTGEVSTISINFTADGDFLTVPTD
jgi:hypothetical protein